VNTEPARAFMGNLIPERVFTRTLPVRCHSPLRRKKRTADPLI
jgi:hypothetical protein